MKIASEPLRGAYRLQGVELTEQGKVQVQVRNQLKLYANSKYMFAFMHPEYGIDVGAGSATWNSGHIVEKPLENHKGAVTGFQFNIPIEPLENGFSQTIVGMKYEDGRCLDMVETWNTLSTEISYFDGLWRSQTTDSTEIMMIAGGHFITLKRSSPETSSFWFGTLEIDNNGNAIKTNMASSNPNFSREKQTLALEIDQQNSLIQSQSHYGIKTITHFQSV